MLLYICSNEILYEEIVNNKKAFYFPIFVCLVESFNEDN